MNFDSIARHYEWIEAFSAGNKLQRCRIAWLSEVKESKRVLIVGEGNGRFLAACARQLPEARLTVVDGSAEMLRLAKKKWLTAGGDLSRVEFIRGAMPGLNLAADSYDLIVTHFFLDCFSRQELPRVIGELASAAKPQAQWLLSDFSMPQKGLRKLRAWVIVQTLYWFFGWAVGLKARTLISPKPWLELAGFGRKRHLEISCGLLYADVWSRPSRIVETV